jgi:hypothetical protein
MYVNFSKSASHASECLLAGEFNDWQPEGMIKGADGTFALTKVLPPGAYAYKFIVDGVWMDDDFTKIVDGVINPVIRVPAPSNLGLFKGDWVQGDGTQDYDKGDVVFRKGKFYRAKAAVINQADTGAEPENTADVWEAITALPLLRTKAVFVTGHNGAGAATATGLSVGDVVKAVVNLTDVADASAAFEATVTVNNQIQQSSASDYSAKKFLVIAASYS